MGSIDELPAVPLSAALYLQPIDMPRPELDLLPPDLRAASASDCEIVLAPALAARAIEVLVQAGYTEIGWEAWFRHADGSLGHPADVIGTAGLLSPEEAKSTIADAASQRHGERAQFVGRRVVMAVHFDVVVAAEQKAAPFGELVRLRRQRPQGGAIELFEQRTP